MALPAQPRSAVSPVSGRGAHGASAAKPRLVSIGAAEIVKAALREDVSLQELGAMAETDPAFAVKVLATVNGSVFGPARTISDLKQAASLLGIRGMRNLALGMVVADMAPEGDGAHLLLANALRRAFAARALAKASSIVQPDDVFIAGLLLEAGILSRARTDFDVCVGVARAPAEHRVVRERANGLLPHPEAGAEMGRSLGLPEPLVVAILHHHDAELPSEPMARVCWVAERVAGVFESGDLDTTRAAAVRAAALIGISTVQLDEILDALPGQVKELADALGSNVGTPETLLELRERAHERLCDLNRQYGELVETLSRVIAAKERLELELVAANRTLEEKAKCDPLTGLSNRRVLEETLVRDLAQADRTGAHLSVVMLDVDHFKNVNDTHGHSVGDLVIRFVADVLKKSVRVADLAARYGGEEFTLILPDTDATGAVVVAERIRAAIERTRIDLSGGVSFSITVSLGTASVKGPGCQRAGRSLVEAADAALYRAKKSGRNRVETASAESASGAQPARAS